MKIIWAGKAYWINFFILYYIFLIIFIGSIVFLKLKKGKYKIIYEACKYALLLFTCLKILIEIFLGKK